MTTETDYLDIDPPINGQNYVCLSFVSPEDIIEDRHAFNVSKFLQSICKSQDMEFDKVMSQYKDFTYKHEDSLQKEYDERNEFKTSVRGIKVRGVYQSKQEAEMRAGKLHKSDSNFHVFVGQVGYWLPWNPCADKIEDETFADSQLNDLMTKYKENNVNKDIFYEDQKRDKIRSAQEERLRAEKEKKAQEDIKAAERQAVLNARQAAADRSRQSYNPGNIGGGSYRSDRDNSRDGGYGGSSKRSADNRSSDLGFSDIRLKDNIELVGKSPSDINIYNFTYLNDSTVYQGVMAQEVPWASVKHDNGYLMVDYNKVDVDFKRQ
jgi:hypothetical protein